MQPKSLCDKLLLAETEETIVQTLNEAGYWDDPTVWRPYGDLENNYGTIGNQQSEAVAALVEKVVNAIDARLTNECLSRGEDPESPDSPQSIREAVHRYFGGSGRFDPDRSGRLANWSDARLNEEGDYITLAATGARPSGRRGSSAGRPSLTISDRGEGQAPDDFPSTFLSLHKNNKIRTKFVQGKFNMGATGALPYCSEGYNFQLIVSRRNPAILNGDTRPRSREWGFTIVRRIEPNTDARSSVFEYLAPIGCDASKRGDVLSFPAETYPIFPDRHYAYNRHSEYGSLVKLYGYRWQGTSSSIIMPGDGGGLIRRVEIALAEPALPVKLYECRNYTANENFRGARGILTDLERNPDDLEEGFPQSADLGVGSHQVKIRVFAFKPDAYQSHRTARHGVLFLYNGQLHASFATRFFSRQSVRKNYLANDLLVTVDCSDIDRRDFEELFMNSRDRLRSDSKLSTDIETKLERFLFENESLRVLEKSRRDQSISDRYDDALRENLLKEILANNPEISKYLLEGATLVRTGRGPRRDPTGEFAGKQFPTFFRPKRLEWGVGVGRTVTLEFETDAENNYFDRSVSPGIWAIADGNGEDWTNHWDRTGPTNGVARFRWDTGTLPPSIIKPGDSFDFVVCVNDESRVDQLDSEVKVNIIEPMSGGGGGGERRTGGTEAVSSPNIYEVHEYDWDSHSLGPFDSNTAVRIAADSSNASAAGSWDFYVNVDNEHIHNHSRRKNQPLEAVRKAFATATVFLGLAIIRGELSNRSGDSENGKPPSESSGEDIPEIVDRIAKYVAPVLLPVIDSLAIPEENNPST
ncbi:MAG: hypothetical protein OXE87_01815 [Chloroflexi bacterium]|nr:hypothetical protein [Chloroflexota bacterium]